MASAAIFPRQKVIRGNLQKPRSSRFSGEYHGDFPIYIERRPIHGKPQPVLDEAGQPVMRRWNNGLSKIVMEAPIERFEDREYIMDDLGNGIVQKNYDFRPTAQELAREEAADLVTPEKLAAFMEEMQQKYEAQEQKFRNLGKSLGLTEEQTERLVAGQET